MEGALGNFLTIRPITLLPALEVAFKGSHAKEVQLMIESPLFQAYALGFPLGEESPPALVAKGEYASAEHIVMIARRHGIPVVEKPELCAALEPIPIDASIPQKLFEAAAALLVEIGALRAQSGRLERKEARDGPPRLKRGSP